MGQEILKLFGYTLSEWTPTSFEEYDANWYRHIKGGAYIGLVRTYSIGEITEPADQSWIFGTGIQVPSNEKLVLKNLYEIMYHDTKYDLSALERGKQNIDNLIIRANGLRCFL